ncbi:DUF4249 domain-containing protein [Mucilaginibacter paludis]|uniref:DUF4249 domain-containing protein n=1 Tax=Mucilaginibacter paludis DSM 18603 TaxID=714943 RepID=H1YG10_9SPHI|nr:DUF4249 domain-containing protein [Mucilaginibacter paludis]EHQ26298.1 hypothetical protein Mucpa_2159 [Mucilaginibacter paludis DSM 18603]
MKLSKLYIVFLLGTLLATSCNRVIDLKLGNDTGRLVVEGNITNIKGTQTVKLSQNVSFDNTNTYPAVSGATVTISDNTGNKYTLTEAPAGTYSVSQLAGIAGNVYTLNILTGGKTYTAASTMPALITLDSITSKNTVINSSKNRKQITVHYQDPLGVVNQYRFVMYVNGVQVKSVFAYNDNFNDGKYAHTDLRQTDIDIYPGDTVQVEMQCIDKNIYTYWYTLMQQQPNGPGGGVTPTDPPSNITPETLGYFSAHTTQTLTLVVKP